MLTEGVPRELIRLWYTDRFELIANRQLLFELEKVLFRDKFRRYVSFSDLLGYVVWIHERAEIRKAELEIPRYTADPDDEYLVALVLSSEADVLVSGDRHLLDLENIRYSEGQMVARVLTPREFLDELR